MLTNLDVPVVFATAYGQQDLIEAYARMPRCEMPFDMRQLVRVMTR